MSSRRVRFDASTSIVPGAFSFEERSNPVEQSTTTRQRGFSIARGKLDQLVVDGNLAGMRELLETDGSDPNESGRYKVAAQRASLSLSSVAVQSFSHGVSHAL